MSSPSKRHQGQCTPRPTSPPYSARGFSSAAGRRGPQVPVIDRPQLAPVSGFSVPSVNSFVMMMASSFGCSYSPSARPRCKTPAAVQGEDGPVIGRPDLQRQKRQLVGLGKVQEHLRPLCWAMPLRRHSGRTATLVMYPWSAPAGRRSPPRGPRHPGPPGRRRSRSAAPPPACSGPGW